MLQLSLSGVPQNPLGKFILVMYILSDFSCQEIPLLHVFTLLQSIYTMFMLLLFVFWFFPRLRNRTQTLKSKIRTELLFIFFSTL